MKTLIALFAVVAFCSATPEPVEVAEFIMDQMMSVDGSYQFSFTSENISRSESRSEDGTVHGAYQYLDSEGEIQKVTYEAGVEGVKLQATNLPLGSTEPVKHTPEVLKATEEHYHAIQHQLQMVAQAAARHEAFLRLHPEMFPDEVVPEVKEVKKKETHPHPHPHPHAWEVHGGSHPRRARDIDN